MYYVYTRRVLKNGVVRKGYKTFETRSAQAKYVREAPISIVITSHN
jgi:hypothetical protein